jgi:preprotein translocase subunit SecD
MAPNRKISSGEKDKETKEMNKVLSDLKTVLRDLSTVVTRFEKCLSQYQVRVSDNEDGFESAEEEIREHRVSVSKRVNAFLKQSKQVEQAQPQVIRRNSSKLVKPSERRVSLMKQKSVTNEAINEIVVDTNDVQKPRNSVDIQGIKKKFEFTPSSKNHDYRENVDIKVNTEDQHKNKELKVDIQSLKQKFETESNDGTTTIRFKSEEIRRQSEERKEKTDELRVSGEYTDKVKKILKYFQPYSK